jgi:thiol:disulfide interchange protein DsbD
MRSIKVIIILSFLFSCLSEADCNCHYTSEDLDYGYNDEYNYSAFHKIEDGQECSINCGKPMLILFTGWNTSGNWRLPWKNLNDPAIRTIIEDNFAFITLYVDDKRILPNGKSLGETNLQLEKETFGLIHQPMFVIADSALNVLSEPIGYEQTKVEFKKFLLTGMENYTDNVEDL